MDRWTTAHVAAGAALGLLLPLRWVVVAALGFEAVEARLRRVGRDGRSAHGSRAGPAQGHRRGLFEHESTANIVADIVAGAAGALAARLLIRRRKA